MRQAPDEALSTLLRAWREVPHPRLAECIEALSDRVAVPSLRGRTNKATAERFHQVVAGRRDDDLAALLAVFPVGGIDAGTRQIEALRGWPRDPRLAARLLALIDDPPYRSRKALPFWECALQIVAAVGDPRSRTVVAALIGRIEQCFAQPMRRLMRERLESLRAQLPETAPALDDQDLQTLGALQDKLAGSQPAGGDRDRLLAAIHADPDNDELRLVYADACLQVGDPRGELIMIQHRRAAGGRLTSAQRKREQALLKAHTAEWLGDLAPVLLSSSIRLRLGLLDACTLKPKHDAHLRPLIGDPRWATVRHLTVAGLRSYYHEDAAGAVGSVQAVILHPVMRALRIVDGELRPPVVLALCAGATERAIERLEVQNIWTGRIDEIERALVEAPALPQLSQLIYRRHQQRQPGDYEWLLGASLAHRLQGLQLTTGFSAFAAWVRRYGTTSLATLTLSDFHDHSFVVLTRAPDGAGLAIEARFRWPGLSRGRGDELRQFAEQLAVLDRGSVGRLQVRWGGKYGAREEQRRALVAAVEHLQPGVCKIPQL